MSTILNTLKKLEEEKSVLEKNINLKGLLLQGQETTYPQMERSAQGKWGLLGGMIIGGVLLGGLVVYFFPWSEPVSLEAGKPFVLKNKPSSLQGVKKPLEKVASNPGIPLAGIPELEPLVSDDPLMDEEFFGPEAEASIPMAQVSSPSTGEQPELEGAAEIREIENLIQAATSFSDVEIQDIEAPVATLGELYIPGLKLKGIIFFSPNNPANHVFVATNSAMNKKLMVGDTILNATLEFIEAQKAIFSYHEQWVETVIGE